MGHLELQPQRHPDRRMAQPEKVSPALVSLVSEKETQKTFPHELPSEFKLRGQPGNRGAEGLVPVPDGLSSARALA